MPPRFRRVIPVVDLFAGPGGLGEGFASFTVNGINPFRIALSIEKDARAHETLQLRAFFRQFARAKLPNDYYRALRQEISIPDLYNLHPRQAQAAADEAWNAELGKVNLSEIRRRIDTAVAGQFPWLLIGGPPCQVYSTIGRARQKGNPRFECDERHRLYVEYLQVLADHRPAVFVMENVKGLLSSTYQNQLIFERILSDLQTPSTALRRESRRGRLGSCRYRVYSLVQHGLFGDLDHNDYVVRMENYGIPQARHRLIILGVREDIGDVLPPLLRPCNRRIPAAAVLTGLPRLRSGISHEPDGAVEWLNYLRGTTSRDWYLRGKENWNGLASRIEDVVSNLTLPRVQRGGEFVKGVVRVGYKPRWYLDKRLGGACNHRARKHMPSDLDRYLFASCFAAAQGRSPELADFPSGLLPAHRNAAHALNGSFFADRFRVQMPDRPSTTITSHISKDGHYYIHPDPSQCRALTVREAARLQTFPDNYLFCGPRTEQFKQVGNAVPPLLALQIARIIHNLFIKAGLIQRESSSMWDK